MEFKSVFKEFTAKVGLDADFDADGNAALLFDGEHEITFTIDNAAHAVFFHSEITDIALLDLTLCRRLLSASFLGAQTDGAAFAVHDSLGVIVLWKRFSDVFADVHELEKAIDGFLAQTIAWKKHLKTQQHNDEEENTAAVIDFQHGLLA